MRMTSLLRISRILLMKPHGEISSDSNRVGHRAVRLWEHFQPDTNTRTRTAREVADMFSTWHSVKLSEPSSLSSRQRCITSANVVAAPLSSRHCSREGLAPRCGYGAVPGKTANEESLAMSNPSQSVCARKMRHCSGLGLASSCLYGTGAGEPSNANAPSRSNPSRRTCFPKWRLCSGHVLALRQSYGMRCCEPSSENNLFLSNSSLRSLQKRRICSQSGLAPGHISGFGCCESSNGSPSFPSDPSQRRFLQKARHCSVRGLAFKRGYGTSSSESANEGALSMSSPSLRAYLQHLVQEHQGICGQIADETNAADGKKQRRLRRRLTELAPVVEKMKEWKEKQEEVAEIEELMAGAAVTAQDKEMKEMARQEKHECLEDIDSLEKEILSLLTPADEVDDNDIIMEFSAGVGGQEAMLFTADMFEMYERFAAYKNWNFQRLEYFTTDLGGLRRATVSVSGDGAYRLMKHEAGVHRVQRVPKTEKSGRIHTSTMTVAVLPQPTEIDLKLDPKDLRVETKKASGAGGQHVNTTDSAVRILHIPTGIAAESQQERSQLKNRAIAMTLLQTRIYGALLEERQTAERSLRRSQVGTSGRSEKIRTYNFQQDRVTDHRVGRRASGVEGFLSGGDGLAEMLSSLDKEEEEEAVARMVEEFVASQKER